MARTGILVIGSLNTDMVLKIERFPQPGETVLGAGFSIVPGGKGANQAVAAARAGGEVGFLARVGRDVLGQAAVTNCEQAGVDTAHIVWDAKTPTGVALIFVDGNGENSIGVASGANAALSVGDLTGIKGILYKTKVLLLQLETPLDTVVGAAELAAQAGVHIILNPAPARLLPARLLELVSVLTPNEAEAEMLTGITITDEASTARAANRLLEKGVKTVVLTLGAKGAFIASATARQFVPAFRVQAVDTTGAGDIFNGALAVGLSEGKSIFQASCFASAAAALSVTRLGAQSSAPTRQEIEDLLMQNAEAGGERGKRAKAAASGPKPAALPA